MEETIIKNKEKEELNSVIEDLKQKAAEEDDVALDYEIEYFERKEPAYIDVENIVDAVDDKKDEESVYKQKDINWQKIALKQLKPIYQEADEDKKD